MYMLSLQHMQNLTAIYPCNDCVGELKFTCFRVSELIIVLRYVVIEFNKGDSTLLSVCSQAYIQQFKENMTYEESIVHCLSIFKLDFHAWHDGHCPQPWTE